MDITKGLNKVRRGIASFSLVMMIAGFFAVSVAQAATFTDVQPADWFYTYVETLATDGILNTSVNTYRPGDLANRAEMAKLAVEAFKLTLENPDTPTFKDVPKGSWFYQYVETAAKNGIVGGYKDSNGTLTGYYGPGDNLTREQAMKILVLAAPLTANTKGGPHFPDVPQSAWSYEYVETGYNWSVVDGYPDGTFGPGKNINRAEIAKMVVNSMNPAIRAGAGFEISSVTAMSATSVEVCFSSTVDDVLAGDKANYAIKDATNTTLNVTSAGLATDGKCVDLVTASQVVGADYVLEVMAVKSTTNEDLLGNKMNFKGYDPNATTVTGGDLGIALSPDSPVAANVPCNAQSLTFARYNLTAGAEDAIVNSITFKRANLGTKDDFSKVWIENKDGMRITSRQTIGSDDYVTMTFNPALIVGKNTPSEIALVAKLKAFNDLNGNGIKDAGENCYTGRINDFVIENSAAVSTSGGNVTGQFPIVSAPMTTADYTTANMTGVMGGSATTYQVGELNSEFAQWKITNTHATRDILIKTMTIKNEGTGRIAKDLANLSVVVNGTKVSTAAVMSGEYVTFNMNSYVLTAGRTDTFYVRADVVGMDNAGGDTIQFTVRYPEDVNAVEASTGFGVSHNLDTVFSTTAAPPSVTYTILGGDTTFVKDNAAPSSQTKPRGATAVTFLQADLIVKQEFTTDAIKVKLYDNVDAGGVATLAAADLKNIKLYVDNMLVQSKAGDVADFTGPPACVVDNATFGAGGSLCYFNFDSTVILKQGTRVIKLVGDIEQNAVAGHKYRAEISGATAFLAAKYTSNDRAISAVAGTVTGGDVTIGASNLTITENSGYAFGQTVVAGAQNLVAAKFTLKANQSDDVKVTRMKFTLVGNGVNGSDMTSASLFVNGVQNGSTKSFTTGVGGSVEFNDLSFTIPTNGQSTIELHVNLTNSAAGNLLLSLAQLDAKDTSSTDANINGKPNDTTACAAGPTAQSQVITVTPAGVGQVYTFSVNGKAVAFTSVLDTNAEISTALAAALNASAAGSVVAASLDGVPNVVLTSRFAGSPFTFTITAPNTTAGAATANVACTGGGYQVVGNVMMSKSMFVTGTGAINVDRNDALKSAIIVPTGVTEQEIARYTLGAQKDDVKITNIALRFVDEVGAPLVPPLTVQPRIASIALYKDDGTKVVNGSVQNDFVNFDIGDASTLIIPKDSTSYKIYVKATFNPITQVEQTRTVLRLKAGVASPGDLPDAVNGIRAVSVGNNSVLTVVPVAANAMSNAMLLTKTKLTIAAGTATGLADTLAMGDNRVFPFNVTADAADDAELASVYVNVVGSAGVTWNRITVIDADSSNPVGSLVVASASGVVKFTGLDDGGAGAFSPEVISKGTTKHYIVKINVTAVGAGPAGTNQLTVVVKNQPGAGLDDTFTPGIVVGNVAAAPDTTIWSDKSQSPHALPAIAADWFNGFKVPGLDSLSSRTIKI